MIKWPDKAKAAIRKLFEPLQDIDVYVEDANDEPFYRSLLNTACNGEVKISRVFALGGKIKVVDAAKKYSDKNRKALFIVDGDLEWVRGVSPASIPGLHQHEAYCIENLLFCESAILKIVSEETISSLEDAKITMNYEIWCQSIISNLTELFAVFGAANELAPHIKTVARGVQSVTTGGKKMKPSIDAVKVASLKLELQRLIEDGSCTMSYLSVYARVFSRICALNDPMMAISGKDFLLPLLNFRLQEIGCHINARTLRMRLVNGGDISRFFGLKNAIIDAAKS